MLAMSCDWRVMALADPIKGKPLTIGLNETKLGIVAPFWFADTMEYVVGARQTDLLLQTGALLTTEEALAVGLIDEAVAHDQVMSRAAVKTKEFLSVPDSARHASKMLLRAPMAERLLRAEALCAVCQACGLGSDALVQDCAARCRRGAAAQHRRNGVFPRGHVCARDVQQCQS